MKRALSFAIGFCLLLLVGCDSPHNESSVATTVQYTVNEDKEANSSCDSIDDMLTESYPWRKAYAEFLWDRERLNAELERQFKSLTSDNYEYYTPELGLLFIDEDKIPELLVYYRHEDGYNFEYYSIYQFVPASKEHTVTIEPFFSGSMGKGRTIWKYLPHGNAFYTGYFNTMHGFYDYDLVFYDNGKWLCWDDVPVITSRMIAENYGVFDGESINIHDVEPMFSADWCIPELRDEWTSLDYGDTRYFTIEAMFGEDAVAGLPRDTD